MMTPEHIKQRLDEIVAKLRLTDAIVDVEQPGNWIHIVIATRDFEGKTTGERENLIWRVFEKEFDDETILSITQCYLVTPEEYEETFSPDGSRAHEPSLSASVS
ncbi:MAG: hypothetical protein HY318_15775 [Armatimonadetes bacterium]|nr:hypothetical protein [Armatimonadota bacterium]